MLKLLGLSLFAFSCLTPLAAADTKIIKPLEAVEQFGGFAISDGSSFYSFSKDGSFESGPIGLSGRTMTGRWAKDADGRLVATVKLGWINGLSRDDQYRRVVFHVSHLIKREVPLRPGHSNSAEIFDGYFFIDEMTAIPQPAEESKKDKTAE